MIFLAQYGFSMMPPEMAKKQREDIIKSNPSVDDAYEYLFNLGTLGQNYRDIYLRIIVKDKNAEELLKILFKETKHNAAKITTLEGLYHLNSPDYNKLKKKLRGEVTLFHGCYVASHNARKYFKKYESEMDRDSVEVFINQSQNNL